MSIAITVASIIAIAGFVWLANRRAPFTVCPICVGVSLTWVWLIGAHIAGYQINLIVPALLMGGSVVGATYQLEKRHALSALWKLLFIPAGFVAAYALLESEWYTLLLAGIVLLALLFQLLASRRGVGPIVESSSNIEKQMKDCC